MDKTVRHIGLSVTLSRVDPLHYAGGWDGALSGPANDARLFESVLGSAAEPGAAYTLWQYPTEKATRDVVINAIDFAATRMAAGSTLVFYVAAHGGQVPNLVDGAGDPLDAICLYDGMLLDVEINELWTRFDADVRIVMLADTCSSGTIGFFEKPTLRKLERRVRRTVASALNGPISRAIPADVVAQTFDANRQQYEQWQVDAANRWENAGEVRADILQIGACADGAEAIERGGVGVFTSALHHAYGDSFMGSYRQLYDTLRGACVPQEPTYESSCADDDVFSRLRALSPTGLRAS
jgi:hypothetical protein